MTYTADILVEQPAIKLYSALGWVTIECWDEEFGSESPFGRENRGDVVLPNRLREALGQLNPDAPKLAIDEAIEALSRDRSAMLPVPANEDIYQLLREATSTGSVMMKKRTLPSALSTGRSRRITITCSAHR